MTAVVVQDDIDYMETCKNLRVGIKSADQATLVGIAGSIVWQARSPSESLDDGCSKSCWASTRCEIT